MTTGRKRAARYGWIWCSVPGLAVIAFGAHAAGGAVSATPDYVGSFLDQPESRAIFDLEDVGQRRRIEFQLEKLDFVCEDGVTRPTTLGSTGVRFISGRVFYKERVRNQTGPFERSSIYEVKGRLISGGTAKGWITYVEYDDTSVECNSNGRVFWEAERTPQGR